jgi:hypothetical protein
MDQSELGVSSEMLVVPLFFYSPYIWFKALITTCIGNQCMEEKHTYIHIYGATIPPHLFSVYVPNRLVVGEICYQFIMKGSNASLAKEKKIVFIPYGFYIGYYVVKNEDHAKQEGQVHLEYRFMTRRFRKHDPKVWFSGMLSRYP